MYQVTLNDEDVNFFNSAASILMPMWKAQQFMNGLNGQVEASRKAQADTAKSNVDAQIAEAVLKATRAKQTEDIAS